MHSKAAETAIAAMGVLAAAYDGGKSKLSAAHIAEARSLQRPFVSKILTELARAGLVDSVRGPGGGFWLARDPAHIRLSEIYALFDGAPDETCLCGDSACGAEWQCALYECFVRVRRQTSRLLHETTLAVFQEHEDKRDG